MLTTLEHRGFVRQDPTTRAYVIGDALLGFGRVIAADTELSNVFLDELDSLVAALRETVHIALLRGTGITFVAAAESPQLLRIGSHVGIRFPAHATASGKILLAELSTDELRKRYAADSFTAVTRKTIRSWSKLLEALDSARRLGYATSFEESQIGMNAVAVPIKGPVGQIHGALVLTAPSLRLRRSKMKQYARELRRSATRLAAKIDGIEASVPRRS